ncbi:hypothetical protein DBB36_22720 [Flavobacterium sp. WLB]|uniref:hypothetical protein n=1 Tax=unclassified Flavobacterium TaxID=196869 RepID=UPI0006AB90CD|nr:MULTISPECIES: hypothetical protein [unclassified Flavobacterium]KOP39027.1 hypothetical protein AKO67_05555 [Flavobacterium sp. VMW]OWU89320.1 hypothetical protein APR43_19195 [Flavobacterium sp. NLM]PUU67672.1 hypothetical protein DBB36_22720 [Flavobacterium sp. WLB]
MKKIIPQQKWSYHDKTLKNKLLKLIVCCLASVIINFLFESKNFDKSDIVFSIIFGIAIWGLLIAQKKI